MPDWVVVRGGNCADYLAVTRDLWETHRATVDGRWNRFPKQTTWPRPEAGFGALIILIIVSLCGREAVFVLSEVLGASVQYCS